MKKWGDAERKEILISALQTAKYTSPKRKKRRERAVSERICMRIHLCGARYEKNSVWKKRAGVRMHAHTAQIRPASGTIGAAISVFFIRPLTHAASAEKSPPENSLSPRTFYWHPQWLYLISATISFNKSSKYVDYGSITESNLVLCTESRLL